MSNINFKQLNEVSDWKQIVHQLWHSSCQGSIWNTIEMYEFRKLCLDEKYSIKDLSFLIYNDEKPIGYMFFLAYQDGLQWNARYESVPLCWPCLIDTFLTQTNYVECIFRYIDEVCVINKIDIIDLKINASSLDKDTYSYTIRKFRYIDESYSSHMVLIKDFEISDIRQKYRQLVNKHKDSYTLNCVNIDENVDKNLINEYFTLHVLDAGGKYRSYETYTSQFQTLRNGGIVAYAKDKHDNMAGMLQIAVGKDEAYDASVAIHPNHASFAVSHLLKFAAIKYLKQTGVNIFDLGKTDYYPTFYSIPTKKNYGINFFKDGWSRGNCRKVYRATKFFTESALEGHMKKQKQKIIDHIINDESESNLV